MNYISARRRQALPRGGQALPFLICVFSILAHAQEQSIPGGARITDGVITTQKLADRSVTDPKIEYSVTGVSTVAGVLTFDLNGSKRQTNSQSGAITVAIVNKPTTPVERWIIGQFLPASQLTITWPGSVSGSNVRLVGNPRQIFPANQLAEIAIGWNGSEILIAEMSSTSAITVNGFGAPSPNFTNTSTFTWSVDNSQSPSQITGAPGNLANAQISASAAIARSKVASGTASDVVINDGSGNLSSEASLAISRGGTSAATRQAALNALAPTSPAAGDIIYYDGANWNRLARGNNGDNLTASSTNVSWAPTASGFTASSTDTLTHKTYDANGTGNVLKQYDHLYTQNPRFADGTGCTLTIPATGTGGSTISWQATYSASAATNANYCAYFTTVPPDIDTSVELVLEVFSVSLGSNDGGVSTYTISYYSPAVSTLRGVGPTSTTGFIIFNVPNDGAGATSDIEYATNITLTGWAAALVANRDLEIVVARDGSDASSTTTTTSRLSIRYAKKSQ